MKRLTRISRNAALAVLGATLLSAPLAAQTLRVGLQEDPDVLDPHEARTFVGRIVFQSLCEKLVDVDTQLKFVPRLATSWSFSEDGKTMTMKLRAGAKFHDGTAIDAAAVKANIERAKTIPTSRRKSELKSVERVDVIDPLTVAFRLSAPDAPLLAQLSDRAGMMLSPASFSQPVGAKPICSGPYKFVERVQNDRIVLEKFAEHWEHDRYAFDRVVFRMIPDTTVRLANLRSGQLDMLERLAPSDVKSAKADASLAVASAIGLGYQGLTINVGNGENAKTPMGQDRRVREALSLAIDREAISKVVFEGLYPPAIQPFPPASPYFDKDFPVPQRDVAKAKALLAAAGHPKFSFELMVANNPVQQQLAQVIQAMAAEAGFDIKIRAMEFASQLKDAERGQVPGEPDRLVGTGRPRWQRPPVRDHGRRHQRREVLEPEGRPGTQCCTPGLRSGQAQGALRRGRGLPARRPAARLPLLPALDLGHVEQGAGLHAESRRDDPAGRREACEVIAASGQPGPARAAVAGARQIRRAVTARARNGSQHWDR